MAQARIGDLLGILTSSAPKVPPYRIPRCRACGVELPRPPREEAPYLPTICRDCVGREQEHRIADNVTVAADRVPERYRRIRFTSAELPLHVAVASIQAADRALAALLDQKAVTVVLRGKAGVGKTALAAAMANAVIESARPGAPAEVLRRAAGVRWESAQVLGRSAKSSDYETTAIRERAIRGASEATFLVLDELGREEDPAAIFQVLNARHEQGRPTVATTWLPKKSLGGEPAILTRYDGGTSRRLLEPPHAVLLEIEKAGKAA